MVELLATGVCGDDAALIVLEDGFVSFNSDRHWPLVEGSFQLVYAVRFDILVPLDMANTFIL